MKKFFDAIEYALEKAYTKSDSFKAWVSSKMPTLQKLNRQTHPRIFGVWDDFKCVIYFTLFRLILTVIVLPVICIILPVVGIYKLIKSKINSRKEKKTA